MAETILLNASTINQQLEFRLDIAKVPPVCVIISKLAKKVKGAGKIFLEGGVTDCEYVRYRNLSWVPETAT